MGTGKIEFENVVWGRREREGRGRQNVGDEGSMVGVGRSGGAGEGLIGAMGFAAAETELAVKELAGTIGFESATDRERAFGIGTGKKKGVRTAKHGRGRGRCGDNGYGGGAEIRGIGVGCRSDCYESGIRNGLGTGVEPGGGDRAAILGGTTGAADTPPNGSVGGARDGGGELLGRGNDNALRFGIDDDGNGFFATAQTEEVFDAVDAASRAGKTKENQENCGKSSHARSVRDAGWVC